MVVAMVIQVEKLFHAAVFAFDELDVVDNEEIVGLVLLAEGVVGVVAEGLNHTAHKVFGMHIVNLGFGFEAQQLIAHGLR